MGVGFKGTGPVPTLAKLHHQETAVEWMVVVYRALVHHLSSFRHKMAARDLSLCTWTLARELFCHTALLANFLRFELLPVTCPLYTVSRKDPGRDTSVLEAPKYRTSSHIPIQEYR